MGYRTITQIILIILSVIIIMTYIRPKFDDISKTQGETDKFRTAVERATEFNQRLQSLISQIESFSGGDVRKLEKFMPDTIDEVVVMRDIVTIAEANSLILDAIKAEGNVEPANPTTIQGEAVSQTNVLTPLTSEQFLLTVTGTYVQFKKFLSDVERNAYPLEVVELSFETGEGTLIQFDVTFEAYALTSSIN